MTDRYLARRDKLRRALAKMQLDALLVTNPINVRYLSGFTGTDSVLLMRLSDDILISDLRFTIQIEEESPGLNALIRPAGVSISKVIGKLIRQEFGQSVSGRLGVESESMTLAERVRFQDAVEKWELVPTQGLVEAYRQIKDRSEVESIRLAIDVAWKAFCEVRSNLSSNQSELDIRNDLEYFMHRQGAESKSFPSIVGAGPRAALPHGAPGRTTLQNQSHLLIDWGAIVNGYMSDLTRVLIFAPNNKKLRKIYETVLSAQEAAIKAIKPGMLCREIDAVARDVIKDAGFARYFDHGLGHALGLEIHENPRLATGHETVLKPGMVLTVEPGIYIKNWGGVRIEDDVLVTKTGCKVLSGHIPKSFDEMVV